jgi:hypothetical protein
MWPIDEADSIADNAYQRQWKDIKQKYMTQPEEDEE